MRSAWRHPLRRQHLLVALLARAALGEVLVVAGDHAVVGAPGRVEGDDGAEHAVRRCAGVVG